MRICYLGRVDYAEALAIQERLVEARQAGLIDDTLLILEHPPVLTLGVRGHEENIYLSREELAARGVQIHKVNRGGDVTYHGPGQLVCYPIFRLTDFPGGIRHFVFILQKAIIDLLAYEYGVRSEAGSGAMTGIWVADRKIMALGIAVRHGISMHGLALNVNTDLSHFQWINPCGLSKGVTSLAEQTGQAADMAKISRLAGYYLARTLGRDACEISRDALFPVPSVPAINQELSQPDKVRHPKPAWLRVPLALGTEAAGVRQTLRRLALNTVCEQAGCPNRAECFGRGTATFLILGCVCSRNCRFCQISAGTPEKLDPDEPERIADAVSELKLRHIVITSVTRDDLPDGGAAQFAATVQAIRRHDLIGKTAIELLIPDFMGDLAALRLVADVQPDVLGHNVETVPRLYAAVRPQANYLRSLQLLERVKTLQPKMLTKSGLMLGLGESRDEVLKVLHDLRGSHCDMLTIGQYLPPTLQHLPVVDYIQPDVFAWYREQAEAMGFLAVASGPLVRSSYRAEQLIKQAAGGPKAPVSQL